MKKTIITLLLLSALMFNGYSQVKRGMTYGNFILRSNSLLPMWVSNIYNVGPQLLFDTPVAKKYLGMFPEYDIHVPSWTMREGASDIVTRGPYWWRCLLLGDFSHNYNLAIGYDFVYYSFVLPFNVKAGVNYEWRGLCVADGNLRGLHRTGAVVPKASLRLRVKEFDVPLSQYDADIYTVGDVYVEGGVSYVLPTSYNDPNNLGFGVAGYGLRGMAAVGVNIARGNSFFIRYERDFFNFINQPNVSTRIGNLVMGARIFL